MRRSLFAATVLAALALPACGGPGAQSPRKTDFTGPAVARSSTARNREQVTLTVYNGNFGLVREIRTLELPEGRVSLEYRDVAEHIQPETVHIKSLTSDGALSVFEQNYRYDLLNPQKLLEKYVHKHVTLYRWNEATGRDEAFDAEVVSANETPVFKVKGEITYGFPGRVSFPEVPPNLIAKPTLVWLLGSSEKKQKVEVTYLTQELNWRSDYVLTIDDKDKVGDLTGWVTLTNHSGVAYENATLKLVAGDVQRVQPARTRMADMLEKAAEAKDEAGFKEEGFFEYHLYTLGRPTTMLDNEQKQVTLFSASGVKVDKKLIFSGAEQYYRGEYGQVISNQKVGVYLDLENKEQNHLGMPLPKGVVRVYKADQSGAKQFVGEDNIDHTPRDEKIRVKMGEAFDVVGDRKETSWGGLGTCAAVSDWEISLRNHKDEAVSVEDVEPVGGDWQVLSSSLPATRKDAHTFTFDVKIPARGEVKVTYRVRVKWC